MPHKEFLTTDALINWLRRQPASEEYVWSDPVYCMMGRFLADNGSCWGEFSYSDMPGYEQIAAQRPWTMGAALARAEARQALAPPPLLLEGPQEPVREPLAA